MTFKKGSEYHQFVNQQIKTKYNAKAHNYGLWIELAQKHKLTSHSWVFTEWLGTKQPIIVMGNQLFMFFFKYNTLVNLAKQHKYDWKEYQTTYGFNVSIEQATKAADMWINLKEKLECKEILNQLIGELE
jgi:hypothetical protein